MGILTAILLVGIILALMLRGPKTLPGIGRMFGRSVKATKDEARAWRKGDPPPGPDAAGGPPAPPPGP
jgi:Sec-independent protein translocase protein TatA